MELDELKDTAKSVRAPETGTPNREGRAVSTDGLIEELKQADAKEKKRLRRFMALFLLAGVLLSTGFLRTDIGPGYRAGLWFLVVTYFCIAAVSAAKYFKLDEVRYGDPTLVFLKKAEKRYRYIAPWEFAYMIPLLVVLAGAGWLLVFKTRLFERYAHSPGAFAIYAVSYLAVCAFGFFASKKNWKRDKAAVWDKIREALQELENGHENGRD
jgi:hypothetical protein